MAAFLNPGVGLLDRFRLQGKFILIAALVLLPRGHLAFSLVKASREIGEIVGRERLGVVDLAPFRSAISATQQNAALVEQLAASAGSLNQMSQELSAPVDRFRLDEGAEVKARALRRPTLAAP